MTEHGAANFFRGDKDSSAQPRTQQAQPPRRAGTFTRRIGGTTFRVRVHYSNTSRETVSDKIMRLAKNEINSGKAADI